MKKEAALDLLARLESGYSLPVLSPVAMKLVQLATEDSCSAADLAGLVEKDPSLGLRLLRLANSAFFERGGPVTTLTQAVVRVGFQRLRTMALSISLRDTFPFGTEGPLDYEAFWRISLYRGLIAKSLAEELGRCPPEEAFVAGLIMEIGLLVFFDLFVRGRQEDIRLDLEPLEALLSTEQKRFGVDHRRVGEAALRYWKFPEPIVLCQQSHRHGPGLEGLSPLAAVCELARLLSRMVSRTSGAFYAPYEEARRLMGLEAAVVNDILVRTFAQVQAIADSLQVEMRREKDLLEIMERANRVLGRISEEFFSPQRSAGPGSLPTLDTLRRDRLDTVDTLRAVAHEIRNPLLAVGGFARRLAASLEPDSAERRYAEIILEEALRLETALSKMTSGGEFSEK